MKASILALSLFLASSLFAEDLIFDKTTSLLWADNEASQSLDITYKEAQEYCSNLVIGSHSNFRVPTLFELMSLIDYNRYKPAILRGFENTDNEVYWSTTPFVDDKDKNWAVNFKSGKTDIIAKSYDRHVRCVQSKK